MDRTLILADSQDTLLLNTAEGSRLRGRRQLLLTDPVECKVLNELWGQLDGTRTLDELCDSGSTAELKRCARSLLTLLLSEGLIRATVPLDGLPPRAAGFETVVAHLARHFDDPLSAFDRLRQSRILLLGSGAMRVAVAHALLRLGASRLCAASPLEHADRLASHARQCAPDTALEALEYEKCLEQIREFDCAILASDSLDTPALQLGWRSCHVAGIPLLVASVDQEIGFAGPIGAASGACVTCAVDLVRSRLDGGAFLSNARRGANLPGPAARSLLANEVASAAFRALTGGFRDRDPAMRVLHIPTLSLGAMGLDWSCHCAPAA
jgi:hypothetical protein